MRIAFIPELSESTSSPLANAAIKFLHNREFGKLTSLASKEAAAGNEIILVAHNIIQKELLQKYQGNVQGMPTYTKAEYEKLEKQATNIVNNFYKINSLKQSMVIDGVDFSDCLRHAILDEVMILCKAAFSIRKITQNCDKIVVQNKNRFYGKVSASVCKSTSILFQSASVSSLSRIKEAAKSRIAKKKYFDSQMYVKNSYLWKLSKGKTRVLIDSRYVNSLRNINSAAKILAESDFEVYVLSNYPSIDQIFAWAIPEEIDLDFKEHSGYFGLSFDFSDLKTDGIFVYDAIDIFPILKDKLAYYFGSGMEKLLEDRFYFDQVLERIKPSIHIVGDDRVHGGRCHVLASKLNGVKTVEIPHGIDGFEGGPINSIASDVYLAGGKVVQDVMTRLGSDKRKVKIVGWPRYDEMLKSYNKEGSENYVLFAPDAVDTHLNAALVEMIAANLKRKLVVKPHPGETAEVYDYLSKINNVDLRKKNEDITPLLKGSDAVISLASTTCVQALALGKPLVIINTTNRYNMTKLFSDMKVAVEISDLNDVKYMGKNIQKAEKLIRNKINYNKAVAYFCYKIDGKSSERAAKEIIKLAS